MPPIKRYVLFRGCVLLVLVEVVHVRHMSTMESVFVLVIGVFRKGNRDLFLIMIEAVLLDLFHDQRGIRMNLMFRWHLLFSLN